jgi:ribosomal 30S subunit maturation factor RimM
MSEYVHIGKLVATFGVKGELILTHGLGKKTNKKVLTSLILLADQKPKMKQKCTYSLKA